MRIEYGDSSYMGTSAPKGLSILPAGGPVIGAPAQPGVSTEGACPIFDSPVPYRPKCDTGSATLVNGTFPNLSLDRKESLFGSQERRKV